MVGDESSLRFAVPHGDRRLYRVNDIRVYRSLLRTV